MTYTARFFRSGNDFMTMTDLDKHSLAPERADINLIYRNFTEPAEFIYSTARACSVNAFPLRNADTSEVQMKLN